MRPLVSVITPIYNGEKTIEKTIKSVLEQTYNKFEMIIVDDLSSDNTVNIIKKYQKKDKRIKLFILNKKGGASGARNFALKKATGKYIAFLDGDDLWKKNKLEKQVNFMEDNDIYFSYTDYSYIDSEGNNLNQYRKCPKKISYFRMLLGDSVGCLTVMYNKDKVGKIKIPDLKKRNDYALWCVILKKVKVGYKYNEILSIYRKSSESLSSGKKYKLLKYHYRMHREVNKLNVVCSLFFTITNTFNYFINRYIKDRRINSDKINKVMVNKL